MHCAVPPLLELDEELEDEEDELLDEELEDELLDDELLLELDDELLLELEELDEEELLTTGPIEHQADEVKELVGNRDSEQVKLPVRLA